MQREFLQYFSEYMGPLLRTHLALLEIVGLSRDKPLQLKMRRFQGVQLLLLEEPRSGE